MYHNIKVNVVGPMKSGKSKIVKIIEEATAGMGIEVTEQNDLALAPAALDLQNKKEAIGGLPAAPLFGFGAALASLHRLWLNWDDVSAINGVNPYGTDVIDCEIEVIFKSGQTVKVKLGEMIGIKTLSECPLVKQKLSDN